MRWALCTILWDDALKENITFEKRFDQFCERIKITIMSLDKSLIDKTIETMSKTMDLIVENKGQRTKYWLNIIFYCLF